MERVGRTMRSSAPLTMSMVNQRGFSLIEVIFALMIITTLSISLTTLLKSGFDLKDALGQNDEVSRRLSSAMAIIANDIEHAYLITEKDLGRYGNASKRLIKSIFELQLNSDGDVLRMTTMNHVPLTKNANESDTTFIVYRLEEDKDTGQTNLMRGEAKRVPDDFKDDPPMRILARGIRVFQVRAWRGDEWLKDGWSSERGDTRGNLPRMVKVELQAYRDRPGENEQSARTLSTADDGGMKYQTVVTIPAATAFPELRTMTSSVRWDRL